MNKKNLFFYVFAFLFIFVGCNRDLVDENENLLNETKSSILTKTQLTNENHWECMTDHSGEIQSYERNLSPFSMQAVLNSQNCVQIAFYIVRNSDGTGGFNANNIPAILRQINDSYNHQNIYFFSAGVNYINNTNFVDLDLNDATSEFPALIASANNPNAISFYLIPRFY